VAAAITAVTVMTTPLVTAMFAPDHDTLVDTPAGTLTWSPDGRLLATSRLDSPKTVDDDRTTRVWDADDLSRVGADLAGEAVGGVRGVFDVDVEGTETGSAFGPGGQRLATLQGGTVRWWDWRSGAPGRTLEIAGSAPTFSPHQAFVTAVAPSLGAVYVWDVRGRREPIAIRAWKPRVGDGLPPRALAFSADGRTLATAGDGPVRVWDLGTGELVGKLASDPDSTAVTFSPDGTRLVLTKDGSLTVWDLRSQSQVLVLEDSRDYEGPVFSRDGTKLLAVRRGVGRPGLQVQASAVTLWDPTDGRRLDSLTAGNDRALVHSLRLSPDGSTVASAWVDETWSEDRVRIWRLDDAADPEPISAGGARLESLAFSPDGGTLATGWSDDRVRLYAAP